ncbi:ABC transporter [Undibacterium parvum]|uniref:ABC transporter n=2 Tax=Undibacterium parvum TaxID=401471 RepID=A0A3Q9BPP3_9BURK|nr:ABC transporter [Undibacterium parvum]
MTDRKVSYSAITQRSLALVKLVLSRLNKRKNLMLSPRLAKLCLSLSMATLLQACAGSATAPRFNYDFGALPISSLASNAKIAISLADVSAPATLDSNAMLYRLDYDNAQMLRPYAQHRWSMPPAQLMTQRIKARMATADATVVSVADGVSDLPILKIDLDEFTQIFSSASQSHAQISLRATLVKRNKLIAQRYFSLATKSDSADAPGGAKAMQIAVDSSISEIMLWLQTNSGN